jgi:uroporphyrinogen-III decarboxylase
MAQMHDLDSLWVWPRGKRDDWRRDYRLVEDAGEVHIRDAVNERGLALSEDYYAIDFPEAPPYRRPYVQYGESQELVNGAQTYSKHKLDVETRDDVDRLLPLEPVESVRQGGMFEGVRLLAEAIGSEVFLEPGCNSSFRFALGVLGLQEGLIFMRERPEVFEYLVRRMMMQELNYLKVMAGYGVHGAWIADIWADLISPGDYRRFVMPAVAAFIREARKLGLTSHYHPCGRLGHLVEIVNEMKPDAFHLEEYSGVDVVELRRRLDSGIALYGSVHALEILQRGPFPAIRDEARRQIDACLPSGPFVLAVGTEVSRNTPPQHVDALIDTAHAYR